MNTLKIINKIAGETVLHYKSVPISDFISSRKAHFGKAYRCRECDNLMATNNTMKKNIV